MDPFRRLGKRTPSGFVPEAVAFPPVTMFGTGVVLREKATMLVGSASTMRKEFAEAT